MPLVATHSLEITPTTQAAALLEWLCDQQPAEVPFAKLPQKYRADVRTLALCDRAGWVEWGTKRAYFRRDVTRNDKGAIESTRDVPVLESGFDEPFGRLSGPGYKPIRLTIAEEEQRKADDPQALHVRITADGYAALALATPVLVEK